MNKNTYKEMSSILEKKDKELAEAKFHIQKLEDLVFAKDGVILELRSQLKKANAELEHIKSVLPVGYLKNGRYFSFQDMQGETNDATDVIQPLYDIPISQPVER